MNTIEYLIEEALISIFRDKVPEIDWLHFEHEETGRNGKPIGVIKSERGDRTTLCFNNHEVTLYILGAKDELHRKVDEAVGDREQLGLDIAEASNGSVIIGEVTAWTVDRATAESNLYSRTWVARVEAGYSTTNN